MNEPKKKKWYKEDQYVFAANLFNKLVQLIAAILGMVLTVLLLKKEIDTEILRTLAHIAFFVLYAILGITIWWLQHKENRTTNENKLLKEERDQHEKKIASLNTDLNKQIEKWEKLAGRPIDNEEKIKNEVTKMLENAKETLHYFGGADFMGDRSEWKDTLRAKLKSGEFDVYRVIDLKSPSEMRDLICERYSAYEKLLRDEINKYISWLLNHAGFLVEPFIDHNWFYDFDGAPIWKYGMHVMIFDKKDIVWVVTRKVYEDDDDSGSFVKVVREAIIFENRGDLASTIVISLDWLAKYFSKQKRKKDLKALVHSTEADKQLFGEFLTSVKSKGGTMPPEHVRNIFKKDELAPFVSQTILDEIYG